MTDLKNIAHQFKFEEPILDVRPLGNGLINDTFIVETPEGSTDYILQKKNKNIFKDVPSMMDNINKVTQHLQSKVKEKGGDPSREVVTLVETLDGKLFYKDADGEYWTAMVLIPDTITYEIADTPELAEQGGKGIAKFQAMLADMKENLVDILPGFHNMRFRLKQWDEAVSQDLANRKAFVQKEIGWIEKRRDEMLDLWTKFEKGELPTRITHNDTKISNILFDKNGEVLCTIDLDTVLSSMILNDYGDAIRTYTNTGKEDDKNLDNVSINMPIFEAYTRGYLSEALSFLTESELENLAFAAKYITYEQVMRFLMDYLNGDTYYKVNSADHNLIRTRAQFKLLQSMEENFDAMKKIVENIIQEKKN